MPRTLSITTLLFLACFVLADAACNSGGGGGGGGGGPDPDPCAGMPDASCDSDSDGVVNASDLCRMTPDPAQCDSDADGYGNACDCDFDQDGVCDASDDALFSADLGLLGFGDTDMDCDADVDGDDEELFDAALAVGVPGASGLACAGTSPCPDRGYAFPGGSWGTASPASKGVDDALLQDALDYLDSVSGNDGIDETMVIVEGLSIWEGPDIGQIHNTWSVTKSFTATAMGLLLGDGSASYDTLAADHVASLSTNYPTATLRHFVTHGSGYQAAGAQFVPGTPFFTPPGSEFLYWDAAINQFANVLTQIGGESLEALFDREVAGPIGMPSGEWSWGDFGFQGGLLVNGGSGNNGEGILTNARTLARFCHLYLARGDWNGTQVVPSEWVANATRTQVPYTVPNGDPSALGPGAYGHGFFTNGFVDASTRLWPDAPAGAYMAAGFQQNRCWIVPEWDLFVVRSGTNGGGYEAAEENEFLRLLGLALQ